METWVHGTGFVARVYGRDVMNNVDGIDWTDLTGLKEGHAVRFSMKADNWFHAMLPVTGPQQLMEIRVEYRSSNGPRLSSVWVQEGGDDAATGGPHNQADNHSVRLGLHHGVPNQSAGA